MRAFALCFFICFGLSAFAQSPMDSILSKHFEVTGGYEMWKQLECISEVSDVWLNDNILGMPSDAKDALVKTLPSRHRTITCKPNLQKAEVYTNGKLSVVNFMNEKRSGIQVGKDFLESPIHKDILPINPTADLLSANASGNVTFMGIETEKKGGHLMLQAKFLTDPEYPIWVYINPTTYLIDFEIDVKRGIRTEYYDFREVGGLTMAFQCRAYKGGILFHRINRISVDVNPRVSRTVFYHK